MTTNRLGLFSTILLLPQHVTALFHVPLIPNHVLQRRRHLEVSSIEQQKHQQIDSLYQGYGVHYVDLWVGSSPEQRQTVIVGTGSPKTSFPCSKCSDCGETFHTDSYFVEADSSTYIKVSCDDCKMGTCQHMFDLNEEECRVQTYYQEGSYWRGAESIDRAYAGGPHNKFQKLPHVFNPNDKDDADPLRAQNFAFNLRFGCTDAMAGLFKTQMADGIMGMDNDPLSFWHQAYDNKVIDKKAFSLCLSRQSDPSKLGTEAGALTMGGVDSRLHTSTMVYSKLDVRSTFFVTLRKIYLREGGGGNSVLSSDPTLTVHPLELPDTTYNKYQHILLESGTTDTYFPYGLSAEFKRLWKEVSKVSGMLEYSHGKITLTESELNNLPTILLQIEGHDTMNSQLVGDNEAVPGLAGSLDPNNPHDIILAIPPSHYMERNKGSDTYTARFYVDEQGYTATIGANTMMGHDVFFDMEEGSIGFAESHCDYAQLEKDVEVEEEEEENEDDAQIIEEDDGWAEEDDEAEEVPNYYDDGNDDEEGSTDDDKEETKAELERKNEGMENNDKSTSAWNGVLGVVTGLLIAGVGYMALRRSDYSTLFTRGGQLNGEVELQGWHPIDGSSDNDNTVSGSFLNNDANGVRPIV